MQGQEQRIGHAAADVADQLERELDRLLADRHAALDVLADPRTVKRALAIVRRASSRVLSPYDPTVGRALELIRREACSGLAPQAVARLFSASRRSAELRFRRTAGKTIGEAILDVRIAAACEYLTKRKSSVSAIANFCGWKSDIDFRKAFKSRFGIPPLKWKAPAVAAFASR